MLLVIFFYMNNQLSESFFKSLVVIASGISKGADPYILVNGVAELKGKTKNSYLDSSGLFLLLNCFFSLL